MRSFSACVRPIAQVIALSLWPLVPACAGQPPARPRPAIAHPLSAPESSAAAKPAQHEAAVTRVRLPPEPPELVPLEPAAHSDVPPASAAVRDARQYAQRRVLRTIDPLLPDLTLAPPLVLPGDGAAIGSAAASSARGTADAQRVPGSFVALYPPHDRDPLARFYAKLDRLSAGEPANADGSAADRRLRVAVFGASGTTADMWTGYLRAYLQRRFGDGGPGVVAAAPHNRWYRHNELAILAPKSSLDAGGKAARKHGEAHGRIWFTDHPQKRHPRDDHRFGLMMVLMRGSARHLHSAIAPSAARQQDLRIARYEVWYEAHPRGGAFEIRIDGEKRATVSTRASEPHRGYEAIEVEPGPHTIELELSGTGEVRLYGVLAESDRPGVVLDNFGFDGARGTALIVNDETVWAEQMRRRDYDLYLLAYGTNTAFERRAQPLDTASYEADFNAMLDRFARVAPDASCVVMLPSLHDSVPDGEVAPVERVLAMRPIMIRDAHAHGCAVWDGAAFEGGPGALPAFRRAGLLRDDYVHYTRRGAVRMAMAIGDALLQRWDLRAHSAPREPWVAAQRAAK